MKKTNVIQEVGDRVAAILDKADANIADEEKIINDLNDSIAKYEQEKADAVKAGDNDKYKEAKSKLDDLNFSKTYHEERIRTFKTAPLISDSEYNHMVSDIMLQLRKESDANILETVNFLMKGRDKAEALNALIKEANEVLKKLQREVYREDLYKVDNDGCYIISKVNNRPMIDRNKVKSFDDYDYINWIHEITYQYNNGDGSRLMYMKQKVQGK